MISSIYRGVNRTKKPRKKRKPRKPRDRSLATKEKRLARYAARLNVEMAHSEKWFWAKWENCGMRHELDIANDPLPEPYVVVDCLNKKFMYAIEIDGSFHDQPKQRLKDARKDRKLMKLGYTVIRVRAYNSASFDACVEQVKTIRLQYMRLQDLTNAKVPSQDE